jgi:class 3 adenylate cyclase/tetratricopeptide (TPR) repeat protein
MFCDRCGRENPDGFRFCGACGAPLPEAVSAGFEQERKVVSALFCDLVDFTRRAERMDPEDVHGLLRTYYASVRGEFERFGGTVAKFIGDAVFVLYGAPRAHEDDPERAVRAALAGVDAVAELNAAHPALDLHVHIGVTTGEALITFGPQPDESGGLAWGDILNTASRLESAAPADTILVDDATYRATRHVIQYAPAERVHAKGKAEPVLAWQPLAPLARGGLALGHQPLVSRRAELALLRGILDGVRSSRAPQLVTILGEPGIGKSRLVLELFRRIDEGLDLVNFRLGRSPPYPEGISFWALGEIVKGEAGMLATDDAATAESKLHAAVRDLATITPEAAPRIVSHLRSLVGLSTAAEVHGDQSSAAFVAWREFLEALARRRPLVLVFEDIHWSDDGLLDFVDHLVARADDVALLIVATARPELLDRRPHWGDTSRATTLTLPPLSEQEARELVGALAGKSALSDALMHAIVTSASGNPLYSVEFVRMLADRGILEPSATQGRPVAPEALPLPHSLLGIIASRLDSLSADDKGLLQAGAVIGRVVWPGALSAITGQPRRSVLRRLRTLEERAFLGRARQSSVANEPEYRFRHVLIRDVAYGQIPRWRRGEMHQRTAEWLGTLSPDRAVDRAELLAHHYVCAHDLTKKAGGNTAGLADRSRRALRDAGDRALTLHAFPAAERHFRAALKRWPIDDYERPWLLFRLGKSMYYAETPGADVILIEARDALLAAGDHGTAAEAEAFLAYLAHHRGRHDLFSEHLDRAASLVDSLGPSRAKAEVLVDVANRQSMGGQHDKTIAAAAEALEMAQALELPEHEARALSIMGISRGLSGDLAGRDDLERSIAITERIGSHLSADCCGKLADLECQLGNLHACFDLQARARDHAERFGHKPFVRWLAVERVGEGYWTGAWDDALKVAGSTIEQVKGTPTFMEGYCRAMRGRIRLARGDRTGTLDDAARALDFARSAEDPQMLYPALAFRARAEIVVGSLDEGAALADELLGRWRSNVDTYPVSSWAVDLALALDSISQDSELVQTAASVALRTRWLEAVVCFARGDFHAAAEWFARIGSQPDEALARLRAAKSLLDAQRDQEAQSELDRALLFYRRVDARTFVREAESLTGTAVGRTT